METRIASSVAVSEVLNVNINYLVWSVQVRTYLIAQDIWDIVEATDEGPKQEECHGFTCDPNFMPVMDMSCD